MAEKPAITPQQKEITQGLESPWALYRDIAVGDESLAHLLEYEISTLLAANVPGMVGFAMRALLYRRLFKSCAGKPGIGRGLILRNPRKIALGRKVLIDDYAVLDARGPRASLGLGDFASIGRFSTLAAKGGNITLGAGVNIGTYCRIATQSRIDIGESTLIAAYCYIGPGNHQRDGLDPSAPLISRPMQIKGGVTIGKNVWVGARATILDGVTIGEGAIVGAHSLVLEDVPPHCVVVGAPARIVRNASATGNS